jgi:diadenosine tetraphosphate (Ap4A) HIT family hydrolase
VIKIFREFIIVPDKKNYVFNKEGKNDECIFCKVFKGEESGVKVLYINDKVLIALNRFPYNSGHLLVVPSKHATNLYDLTDDELNYYFKKVKQSIIILKKVYSPPGFNIGLNTGQFSGASMEHLHTHIVPRYESETGFMETITSTKILLETLDETLDLLKKHIDIFED